mgnify:CR=1 FL=1
MSKKNDLEHTSTTLGSQNMKSSQRMVSVVEPYELPEGWKWVQQNEVCKLSDGEKRTGTEFPYLEVKYLRGKKEKDFVSTGKFIKAGTKVILVDGENSGEVFTVPEDGFMGSTFKALEISNVNENYLQYFIHTKKDLYRNNKKGSAIPHLDKKLFFTMPFPLPPTLAEQQRIVNRIESMFAKLDEAKEKAQNVVDGFETRKAAILHKAFTGELTAKWRKENGVSDDSWEEKKLQEVCIKEITDGTHKTPTYVDEKTGVPFISGKDVSNEIIDWSDLRYIPKALHEELYARLAPQIDDILLSKNGARLGKAAIVETNMIFDIYVTLALLRPNKKNIFPKYLWRVINSPSIQSQIQNHLTGIGMPNLHLRDIKALSMFVPTLPEQVEIVRILDIIIEKENKAKQAAEAVLEQIDLLKKSILARAFRGKI